MKANKFVKKYSIDDAKELVSSIINTISVNGYVCDPCFITDEGEYVGYNDLKRLVESHELIEQYNGLFEAKELIRVSPKLTSELRWLPPAIADVESCK